MKIIKSLMVISLVSLVSGAPTYNDDDKKLTITKSFFSKEFVKYTGGHEIVNLLLPLNGLNNLKNYMTVSDSDSDSNETDTEDSIVFFVEADVDSKSRRVDQGLYVLKQGKATKILEHGRDAAASRDGSKLAFFGAADGIYVYNQEKNSADKYGIVDDSIIGIAKEKTGDVIYILTENHELFKVSNNGMTKKKIDDVVNAKQIVLDSSNNIYFYSDDKQAYVRTAEGVKKIEGLPEHPKSVNLIKPPFLLDDVVPLIVDNDAYFIYADGSSEHAGFEFEPTAKASAYAPEAALIQYHAYDKKIYQHNFLSSVGFELLEILNTKV